MSNWSFNRSSEIISDWIVSPDLPSWVYILSAVYLSLVGSLAILFNGTIFALYLSIRKLRTDFNLLLVSLILGELALAMFGLPLDILASYNYGWKFGKSLCLCTGFLHTCFGMVSINNLTAISIYRLFMVIEKPCISPRAFSVVLSLTAWLLGILYAVPPLLERWGRYVIMVNGMSCAPAWRQQEDLSYNLALFSLGFFIPLSIIIGSSVAVIFIIKKNRTTITSTHVKKGASKREKQVLLMVLTLVFVFCLSWGPYALLSIIGVIGYSEAVPLYMTVFPVQLAKSSILWNPIIYICMNKTFQQSFHGVLVKYFPGIAAIWTLETSPNHEDLGTFGLLRKSFRRSRDSFRKKLSAVADENPGKGLEAVIEEKDQEVVEENSTTGSSNNSRKSSWTRRDSLKLIRKKIVARNVIASQGQDDSTIIYPTNKQDSGHTFSYSMDKFLPIWTDKKYNLHSM